MIEQDPTQPEGEILIVAPEVDPDDRPESEVSYVISAPAYHSVATDEGPGPVAPVVEPDVIPQSLSAIQTLGEGLNRKLDVLQTLFEREIRAESTREKVVDRLHAELQEYKQGLLLGILRPVFVDLIQLHDDMGKMIASQAEAEGEAGRLLGLVASFQQGVEDILYRQGVEPFTEPGDAFDPRRQRALSTVSTDDPALNKTVAVRLRKGFQVGEKVVRPEMVTVYSYKSRPPESADPA